MTSSQTQNRREREREERLASILEAARRVFFARGIHEATMDDVASAAEVSKGTVYLYFPSKETILAVLLQEGLAILVERLAEAYNGAHALPASIRLGRLAAAYSGFYQEYPHYYRLLMAFERKQFQESVDSELYDRVLVESTRGLDFMVQTIEQGIAEGEFVSSNPRQAASVIWAMLHGIYAILGHPLRREMVDSESESLYDTALELAVKGLKARPAAAQTS